MSTFREQLLGSKNDAVVADLLDLAARTVQAQSGLSGRLVKGAYAAARKVDALNNSTARKIYSPVRGKLVTLVEDHVGDLGEVVKQHVSSAT